MKIALIKSTKHLAEYKKIIQKLGHDYLFIDIDKDNWAKKFRQIDPKVNAYFWQSIDRGQYYRKDILDPVYFIEQNSAHKIFPDFNQYYCYNDKIKQTNILNFYRFPTPKTFYTSNQGAAQRFILQTKYPFVLKDPHSASSLGVYLVKNQSQAEQFIKKIFRPQGFNSLYSQFYAQEFIPGLGKSLRVITVGPRVYCAYWRLSPDDWRHRLDQASTVSDKNIPAQAKKICQTLAAKVKFHWMSWDLLVKNNKMYIIEFSCNFGTAGAEKLGYNPREEIIKYMIKHIK